MKKNAPTILVIVISGVLAVSAACGVWFFFKSLFFDSRCQDFTESIRFAEQLRFYRWQANDCENCSTKEKEAARQAGVGLLLSKRKMVGFDCFADVIARFRLVDFPTLQETDASLAARIITTEIRVFQGAFEDMRRQNKNIFSNDQISWLKIAAKSVKAEIICWEDIGFSQKEAEICRIRYEPAV